MIVRRIRFSLFDVIQHQKTRGTQAVNNKQLTLSRHHRQHPYIRYHVTLWCDVQAPREHKLWPHQTAVNTKRIYAKPHTFSITQRIPQCCQLTIHAINHYPRLVHTLLTLNSPPFSESHTCYSIPCDVAERLGSLPFRTGGDAR